MNKKDKDKLIKYLIDEICDNNSFIIGFLDIRENLENIIDDKINNLNDDEFKKVWNEYTNFTMADILE